MVMGRAMRKVITELVEGSARERTADLYSASARRLGASRSDANT